VVRIITTFSHLETTYQELNPGIGLSSMNIEEFGKGLAQARVAKGISLIDISAETRINLKYLEAMERGQFQILPQTYVRAFLREYALILGLDPKSILQQYTSTQQEGRVQKPEETPAQLNSAQENIPAPDNENKFMRLSPLQRNLALGIVLVVIVILVIVLANMNTESDSLKPVAEIPFDRVIKESEAASIPPPSASADSVPVSRMLQKDSLRLEITTLDSVWISLLIDGTKGEEYLFGPHRRRVWVAQERFIVTMGNAGGATFRLNGKEIGSLGKRGAVVRNAVLTETNLKN
jgi:cytoskeleton protein RodZ